MNTSGGVFKISNGTRDYSHAQTPTKLDSFVHKVIFHKVYKRGSLSFYIDPFEPIYRLAMYIIQDNIMLGMCNETLGHGEKKERAEGYCLQK